MCTALPCQPRYGYTVRMDEILIEERKYVSSKRAAKITGYAKDYIGQLCREGKVPARLVGRSWYVLEAAIHDHRFGDAADEPVKAVKAPESSLQSTWEAPRYEASSAELLPSINRLAESQASDSEEETPDGQSQRLQDSWQAWFNRMADHHAEPIIPAVPENMEPEQAHEPEPEPEPEEDEDVVVPIHAIYQPMVQESLPRVTKDTGAEQAYEQPQQYQPMRNEVRRRNARGAQAVRTVGIFLAMISVIFAAVGSGYLDSYISGSPVAAIAGISVYNK